MADTVLPRRPVPHRKPGPPLVRTPKACPVCGREFTPRFALHAGRKQNRRSAVGVVVCSATCASRFEVEHGVDPFAYAFSNQAEIVPERRCVKCKTPLAGAAHFVHCRVCRVSNATRRAVTKAAAQDERLAKTLLAERLFLEGKPEPPPAVVETLLW